MMLKTFKCTILEKKNILTFKPQSQYLNVLIFLSVLYRRGGLEFQALVTLSDGHCS